MARDCDDPRYDFLYRPARGRSEWYRPAKHGRWSIEQDEEGEFAICCDAMLRVGLWISPLERTLPVAGLDVPNATGLGSLWS